MSNASLTADRPWWRDWTAIGAACVLLNGCASVIHHAPMPGRGTTMQSVEVTSEPTGVRVVLGGDVLGITPTRVLLERKNSNQVLRFEKEGYVSIEVSLARTIDAAIAGNVPFALLALNPLNGPNGLADNAWSRSRQITYAFAFPAVGVAVDFMTGAAYKLPRQVKVRLEAADGSRGDRR